MNNIVTTYSSKIMNFVHSLSYSAIFAADLNGGIGINNKLPWKHPEDMAWFKDNTMGKCIIMGMNTFSSIGGKPLPGRLNIVLTRRHFTDIEEVPGLKVFKSVEDADAWIRLNQSEHPELCKGEVMVIGGAAIYSAYQNRVTRVYKTTVCEVHECDTFLRFNEDGWDLRYMNKPSYIKPLKFEIWDKCAVFDVESRN